MYKNWLHNVIQRREEIRKSAEKDHVWIGYDPDCIKSIKKVLFIASASRSGSSLMFELVKRYPDVISTNGETVPFYKLSEMASDENASDEISESEVTDEQTAFFLNEISQDMHFYHQKAVLDECERKSYAYQLALRFVMQWPMIPFDCEELLDCIHRIIESDFAEEMIFDKDVLILKIIEKLRGKYSEINPYYYDISPTKIETLYPEIEKPSGPPNSSLLIEEPPFLVIDPMIRMDPDQIRTSYLLMKEPVTSYRLELIKKIFSHAEFYWIHLTRNPAGCINGLMDGWLDRGFFSFNIKNYNNKRLNMRGYSGMDRWSENWWNFDRPPGWEDVVNQSLAEVCAFQWLGNNQAIMKGLKQEKNKITIKYEDILSLDKRKTAFKQIEDFIGANVPLSDIMDLNSLPVIQGTKKPQKYRWKERETEILQVLDNAFLLELAETLGYKKDCMVEWL